MADKKKHYHPITFPAGTARYPKISDPDTKGEYADGKHKTEVVLSDEDTKALKKKFQALATEWFPGSKSVNLPIRTAKDGTVSFIAKTGKEPIVVDAKRQKVDLKKVKIGGGSTIRINVTASNYEKGPNKGINLYLEAVQLLNLKSYGDPLAGFKDEDDGFAAGEHERDVTAGFDDETGDEDADAYNL